MQSRILHRQAFILKLLREKPITLTELTLKVELDDLGWSFSSGSRNGNSYKSLFRDLLELERQGLIRFIGRYPRKFIAVD